MKPILSVVIPAHNEAGSIGKTVHSFYSQLKKAGINHEIVVVSDHSTDSTIKVIKNLQKKIDSLKCVENDLSPGFGMAIRKGLEVFKGDYVAIVMADLSDKPSDLLQMLEVIKSKKLDCVFGSRFIPGATVTDYPLHKLLLNRLTNSIIRILFLIKYNDTTNAFKLYSRPTIKGLQPLLSKHFNLTVELPLKAIVRGYRYGVVPTDWTNRKEGVSKLKIREMGSRYFFIILYCWLEKNLSMGDYRK